MLTEAPPGFIIGPDRPVRSLAAIVRAGEIFGAIIRMMNNATLLKKEETKD